MTTAQIVEFKIDQEYVGRVVGAGGAQINKIRESLGVTVHFDQEPEPVKESSKKKKEKNPHKTRVKVRTRDFTARRFIFDATAIGYWS